MDPSPVDDLCYEAITDAESWIWGRDVAKLNDQDILKPHLWKHNHRLHRLEHYRDGAALVRLAKWSQLGDRDDELHLHDNIHSWSHHQTRSTQAAILFWLLEQLWLHNRVSHFDDAFTQVGKHFRSFWKRSHDSSRFEDWKNLEADQIGSLTANHLPHATRLSSLSWIVGASAADRILHVRDHRQVNLRSCRNRRSQRGTKCACELQRLWYVIPSLAEVRNWWVVAHDHVWDCEGLCSQLPMPRRRRLRHDDGKWRKAFRLRITNCLLRVLRHV